MYQVTLYQGRSYSIVLMTNCTTISVLQRLGKYIIVSKDQEEIFKRNKYHNHMSLLHKEMTNLMINKIANALIEEIEFDSDGYGDISNMYTIIPEISAGRDNNRPAHRDNLLDFVTPYVRNAIHRCIMIIADARNEVSFDTTLHEGRVTDTLVLFPINNYHVKFNKNEYCNINELDSGDSCTLIVHKFVDNSGKFHNILGDDQYDDQYIEYSGKRLGHYISEGRVYKDTWDCYVVQIEGILRLQGKLKYTRKVAVRSKSNKPRQRKNALYKGRVSKLLSILIESETERIISIKRRSGKINCMSFIQPALKLNSWFKLNETTEYHEHCERINNEYNRRVPAKELYAIKCVIAWNELSSIAKRYALTKIKSNLIELGPIAVWETEQNEHFKFLTTILKRANKLPNKNGESDEQSNSSPSSTEQSTNDSVSNDRESAWIVVRTSSGRTSVCCGEPSSEETGRDSNECDQDKGSDIIPVFCSNKEDYGMDYGIRENRGRKNC